MTDSGQTRRRREHFFDACSATDMAHEMESKHTKPLRCQPAQRRIRDIDSNRHHTQVVSRAGAQCTTSSATRKRETML